MKLSKMFPRRYATGADFDGKAFTLTVSKVTSEKMRPQPNAPEIDKWVIYFNETQKGVVLNRTLAYQIAEILGSDDTDHWTGQKITLYPQPMTVAGKKVSAIRARAARERNDEIGRDSKIPDSLMEEIS